MKDILRFLIDLLACEAELAREKNNPTLPLVGLLPHLDIRCRTEPMTAHERLMRLIARRANWRARRRGMRGVPLTWKDVSLRWKFYGARCWLCGSGDAISCDHIIPAALGAVHTPDSIAPACRACNEMRAGMTPDEYARVIWRMPLWALLAFARRVGPEVFHAERRRRSAARRRLRRRRYARKRRRS